MKSKHRARAQSAVAEGARDGNRIEAIMTQHFFDHDRLDVFPLSIEYVANAFDTSQCIPGVRRCAATPGYRM